MGFQEDVVFNNTIAIYVYVISQDVRVCVSLIFHDYLLALVGLFL